MGKLKRLSTDVIASLWIEPMTFNQIQRELEENREIIENLLDILLENKFIKQIGPMYQLTSEGKSFFSY
jgi:predicted transcriptional regulator